MSTHRRQILSALVLLAPAACGRSESGADRSDPAATVRHVLRRLGEHDATAGWRALPPRWQAEVKALLAEFAAVWEAGTYGRAVALLHRLAAVGREFPREGAPRDGAGSRRRRHDHLSRALELLAGAVPETADGLAGLDPERFLADAGRQVLEAAAAALAARGRDPFAALRSATVRSAAAPARDRAVLEVRLPGQAVRRLEMVRVEGCWVPAELAQAWPKALRRARAFLADRERARRTLAALLEVAEAAVRGLERRRRAGPPARPR